MKLFNWVAKIGVVILPVALIALPPSPAWGRRINQFDVCVKGMVRSGVEANQAGTACADALIPKELSECVTMIRSRTEVEADDALAACYRVRRPVDLANCVIDIDGILPQNSVKSETSEKTENQPISSENNQLNGDESGLTSQSETIINENSSYVLIALDSCRRSLLPGRYSECVTGLARTASLRPVEAMDTCLKVQDFPSNIFPVYQP